MKVIIFCCCCCCCFENLLFISSLCLLCFLKKDSKRKIMTGLSLGFGILFECKPGLTISLLVFNKIESIFFKLLVNRSFTVDDQVWMFFNHVIDAWMYKKKKFPKWILWKKRNSFFFSLKTIYLNSIGCENRIIESSTSVQWRRKSSFPLHPQNFSRSFFLSLVRILLLYFAKKLARSFKKKRIYEENETLIENKQRNL